MAIFVAKQQIEQTELFLFWDHVANKSTVTYYVCVICSSGAFDTFVLISVANANHLFDKLTLHATILNSIYD